MLYISFLQVQLELRPKLFLELAFDLPVLRVRSLPLELTALTPDVCPEENGLKNTFLSANRYDDRFRFHWFSLKKNLYFLVENVTREELHNKCSSLF